LSITDAWDNLDAAFDLHEAVAREGDEWILRADAPGVYYYGRLQNVGAASDFEIEQQSCPTKDAQSALVFDGLICCRVQSPGRPWSGCRVQRRCQLLSRQDRSHPGRLAAGRWVRPLCTSDRALSGSEDQRDRADRKPGRQRWPCGACGADGPTGRW